MAEAFFDTNVLLYTTSDDVTKADRAHALLESGGTISVQVLNESVSVLRRKNQLGWEAVVEIIDGFKAACDIAPLTVDTHDFAVAISRRYGLRIDDASIIAAAKLAGCTTVWSEDMQDGQVIEGVTIRNPF